MPVKHLLLLSTALISAPLFAEEVGEDVPTIIVTGHADGYDATNSVTALKTDTPLIDVPQTVVTFGSPGVRRSDPDFMAAYVVNHILGGGGLSSRLYREVREKRGLAYSVYGSLLWMDHSALFPGFPRAGQAPWPRRQTLDHRAAFITPAATGRSKFWKGLFQEKSQPVCAGVVDAV